MPEHSSLTGDDLHEPKGAATASAGMVYYADGAGSGEWKRPTGWEHQADGTYTETSKRSISAGTTVAFTVDGTDFSRGQGLSVWDTATNQIVAEELNNCYSVRVELKCSASTAGYIDFAYDADGVNLVTRSASFVKGSSVQNNVVTSLDLYASDAVMNAGGLDITITSSEDIEAWDFRILIIRSHLAY